MFEDILSEIKNAGGEISPIDVMCLNPLTLAYIGDAVYEIFIRTVMIASEPNKNVHQLHLMSTDYVKAHSQSDAAHKISSVLSEEELTIVKRGRNSKSGYVPKNADVVEYRTATGFEALIGYLYLSGNTKRLKEVLNYSISRAQDIE
jgi:ribonuclease III family protein